MEKGVKLHWPDGLWWHYYLIGPNRRWSCAVCEIIHYESLQEVTSVNTGCHFIDAVFSFICLLMSWSLHEILVNSSVNKFLLPMDKDISMTNFFYCSFSNDDHVFFNYTVAMTSHPSNESELQLYRVLQRANLLAYYDTFICQGK